MTTAQERCSLACLKFALALLVVSGLTGCGSTGRTVYRSGRTVVKGTAAVVKTTAKVTAYTVDKSAIVVSQGAQVATKAVSTGAKAATVAARTSAVAVRTTANVIAHPSRAPVIIFKDLTTGLVKEIPWKEGIKLYAASKQAELDLYMKGFKIARSTGVLSATWTQLKSGSLDPFLRPGDVVEVAKLMGR
ncbi:MAG: hypothetical protein AB1705_18365 [Verrucomicrobiota bacterium]